jgi:NTE family protein
MVSAGNLPISMPHPALLADWLAGLQRLPIFGQLRRRRLFQLLLSGRLLKMAAGAEVCREGQPGESCFLVLEGSLQVSRDGVSIHTLGPGDPIAVEPVLAGKPYPATVTALMPSMLLGFARSAIEDLVRNEPLPLPGEDENDGRPRRPTVLQLRSPLGNLPLAAFGDLLAQTMVADFGERVLLLIPPDRGAPERPTKGPDGVFRVAGTPEDAAERFPEFHYIFIDGWWQAPGPAVDELVYITRGTPVLPPPVPPERDPTSYLPTVLLEGSRPRGPKNELTADVPDHGQPDPRHAACFLKLDVERIRARWQPGTPLSAFDAATRSALSLWARAVTRRRVGVALGGGGAWGFYHVVVLRRLLQAGVPVDVVSSASMGSVVGAFFAARGLAGLDQLIQVATRLLFNLDWVAAGALVSTAPIEWLINRELGVLRLEDLNVRFHPVASNLHTGESAVLMAGELGMAVRASASAPGVWAPTLVGQARYVDGCVTDNVPAPVLSHLGADLSFASNIYPFGTRNTHQWLPGPVGRFWAAFSPMGRMADLTCSGSLMLHQSGEWQAQWADVYYDASKQSYPLVEAMEFRQAERFIEMAEADPALTRCIDKFIGKWKNLDRDGSLPTARVELVA